MATETDATFPLKPTDSAGLEQALSHRYPLAYRLAVGLCGGPETAAGVASRVLARAAALAPRWATADGADRWFLRFTVLCSRPVARGVGPINWLAPLPLQQREVVVLYHGLGLDLHRAAAAMDCSTTAAANHLVAATKAIGAIDTLTAELPGQLEAIVPPPAELSQQVVRAVARHRWRQRLRRWGGAIAVVGALAGLAWAGWQLWRMLVI